MYGKKIASDPYTGIICIFTFRFHQRPIFTALEHGFFIHDIPALFPAAVSAGLFSIPG